VGECKHASGTYMQGTIACAIGGNVDQGICGAPAAWELCRDFMLHRAETAEARVEAFRGDGIALVEKHLREWGRGEPLTDEQQRDVHLVALGALLIFASADDKPSMLRLHKACGCIVCRGEAKAKGDSHD